MIGTIPQLLEALSNVPTNRLSDGEFWRTELDDNELVLWLDVDPWLICLFGYSEMKKLTASSDWIYSHADGGDKLVFTRDVRL
jgi:hypothetical protein